MATGRITKNTVDSTHAAEKDKLVWDDKLSGFGLKVTPSGSKIFIYQYRIGGRGAKVRRYTIGKLGGLTPDSARKVAERLAMLVAQGTDPQRVKVEKHREAVDLAFAGYLDRFVSDCLKVKWPASWQEAEASLRKYAIPVLTNKSLTDVSRADIRSILAPVRKKPATAHKLFAILRRLFNWAVSEGDLKASPMNGMEAPPAPPSRDRVLSDEELSVVWSEAGALGYPFGPFVRLLILTGARREEVAGLSWSELDHGKRIWSLPAARAKNGRAAEIPLSALAVTAIDALAMTVKEDGGWPRRGLIFSTTGKTPVSGYSRAKARLDHAIANTPDQSPLDPWTFHDLRRTFATGMQRLGVRFEVTEAILNHVSGSRSGVAGVYQRHDWALEKASALQAWSDHILRIISNESNTNVVPFAATLG